jgi:peptidoglycan/xylan/chitin deacetylase (PgdA/CDA1 family)
MGSLDRPPAAQLRFLARHRHVVSMTTLVGDLIERRPVRPGTVAITIDDGYRDTLEVAAPLLHEHGLPATVYLATDAIDAAEIQWVDRLYAAFRARTRHRLALPGSPSSNASLEDPDRRRAIYHSVCDSLQRARPCDRASLLLDVERQLRPAAAPPRLTLTWPEVRDLTQRFPNVEIGAHTAGHVDLSRNPDLADDEVCRSVDRIRDELGLPPAHFSFPYGRSHPGARPALEAAGLRSAVADSEDPVLRPGTDRFHVPRLPTPTTMTRLRFWTSGAFPDLSRRVLGRT